MSHLLAASPSPHLLPWLAACSLSGEALATMLSATVPPLEPPGQQLPLCCRRSLLTLMLNIGFVCPLKHHCTCLTFTCQRCKMGVQEKPEEQRVKCSSLHGALMLRKGQADGRGVTPAQQRGDCRHGVCAQEISQGLQAHWHKNRHIRTVAPSERLQTAQMECLFASLCTIEQGWLDLKNSHRLIWMFPGSDISAGWCWICLDILWYILQVEEMRMKFLVNKSKN